MVYADVFRARQLYDKFCARHLGVGAKRLGAQHRAARVRPYDICSCVFNAAVWYLDLFAGRNDHAAVQRAGTGGHKEINRTNLTCSDIAAGMKKPIVQKQIELLRMRNQFPVFSANAKIVAEVNGTKMDIRWQSGSEEAVLQTDFGDYSFSVSIRDTSSDTEYFKYDS